MERGFGSVNTTPTLVSPTFTNHFLPFPENTLVSPQLVLQPALQVLVAPAVEAKMSLFSWQIQQEATSVEGVSPELLNMQDEDGDTYV